MIRAGAHQHAAQGEGIGVGAVRAGRAGERRPIAGGGHGGADCGVVHPSGIAEQVIDAPKRAEMAARARQLGPQDSGVARRQVLVGSGVRDQGQPRGARGSQFHVRREVLFVPLARIGVWRGPGARYYRERGRQPGRA